MSHSISQATPARHRLNLEGRPNQAKASLKKVEKGDLWADLGRVVARALELHGWKPTRLAQEIERGEAQVSRWINGTEGVPWYLLWAIEELRPSLVLAQAENITTARVEVASSITIRRSA